MNNLYKKIVLDDTHYINIYYDEYASDPTDWGSDVRFCIREHRRYTFPNQLEYDWDSAEEDAKKLYEDYWIFNLDFYEHS